MFVFCCVFSTHYITTFFVCHCTKCEGRVCRVKGLFHGNSPLIRWAQASGVQKTCRYGTSGHGLVDMVALGWQLDLMILEVFSNLNDSTLWSQTLITLKQVLKASVLISQRHGLGSTLCRVKGRFWSIFCSSFRVTLPIEVFIVWPLQKFKSKGRNDLKSLQLGEGKLFLHPCNCSGCTRKERKTPCSKLITLSYKKAWPQTGNSEIWGTKAGRCQKPRGLK